MITDPNVDQVDEYTCFLYLEIPGSQVVIFQALFECYEGVAIARTLNLKRSLVCLVTTVSMVDDCLKILQEAKDVFSWRFAPKPTEEERRLYLGYQKGR